MPGLHAIRTRVLPFVCAVAITLAAFVAMARADGPGEAEFATLVRNAVDLHIRPAHERLAQRAELLDLDVSALCDAPSPDRLEEARRSFAGAVLAMSALEIVRVGPVAEASRRERLAFWPDARGRGLAQVQRILADEDETAASAATLAGKSVAVQGLPALEFLLHGTGAEEILSPGSFRCRYARAAAANVRAIAEEMAAAWDAGDGPRRLLTEPGPDNPLFLDHAEAAGELMVGMATALESIADQKLRAALGEAPGSAKPKLAPWWRSELTIPAIGSTLEATQHMFEVSGAVDLLPKEMEWLGNAIRFEMNNAVNTARALQRPIGTVVTDTKDRDAAKYLAVVSASLRRAVGQEYTAAVGLEQGFNALDGD